MLWFKADLSFRLVWKTNTYIMLLIKTTTVKTISHFKTLLDRSHIVCIQQQLLQEDKIKGEGNK